MTSIADQVILQDGTTGPLGFTISGRIIADALRVTAAADDPTLVPASSLGLSGSGGHRAISVTPADGRSGSTVVTVTVDDGLGGIAQTRFRVTIVVTHAGVPQLLRGSLVGDRAVLTWAAPEGGTPVRYAVGARTASGIDLPFVLVDGTDTSVVLDPLPPGAYTFRVLAVGNLSVSQPTGPVSLVVPASAPAVPGPPTAPGVLRAAADRLRLSWYAPAFGPAAERYEIEGATAPGVVVGGSPVPDSPTADLGIEIGPIPVEWLQVRAVNAAGRGYPSTLVHIPSAASQCTAPPAPPVLLPPVVAFPYVTFSWLPGEGDSATSHRLEVAPGLGLDATFALPIDSPASIAQFTVPPNLAAAVRVVAINACGESAESAQVGVMTTQ